MSTATHDGAANGRMDSPIDSIYSIRHIPRCLDTAHADTSALELVRAYSSEWEDNKDHIDLVTFTEGITNTLMKATIKTPGKSPAEIDQDAILIRAYGKGTDVLIDRQRELSSHSLLASRGLAPPLLAHFDNGLMYRYMQGDVCSPEDLRRPEVYRQVAKRIGEWHGSLPISAISSYPALQGKTPGQKTAHVSDKQPTPTPNIWTVTSQWIDALPATTPQERERRDVLRTELTFITSRFSKTPGLFGKSYVFGHCDLLSGNVIIQPRTCVSNPPTDRPVSFIDYEYATPAPAAFDIANHFAEWGGFDCDHAALPTKSSRRDFITNYVSSFYCNAISDSDNLAMEIDFRAAVDQLYAQVDDFRGIPGFYWGVWALIQATISQIDFNYAEYAEIRLGEYWGWKAEMDGSRAREGRERSLRERRWDEE